MEESNFKIAKLEPSKTFHCGFCNGYAWIRFEEPNPLNAKGGCCPRCNPQGLLPNPGDIKELVTLKLHHAPWVTN